MTIREKRNSLLQRSNALPGIIGIGWKNLRGKNTLAFCDLVLLNEPNSTSAYLTCQSQKTIYFDKVCLKLHVKN